MSLNAAIELIQFLATKFLDPSLPKSHYLGLGCCINVSLIDFYSASLFI